MKKIPLHTIQQWLQAVVEHPGSDSEAWKSDQAQKTLPFTEAMAAILPSKTLSPMERISIYRRMFFLRMTESMAIDYPGVKNYLGEEEFDRIIAEEYVKKYHSTSYTLNHLGKYFPKFIKESDIDQKDFLFDLARLEFSITTVMDSEESVVMAENDIRTVPAEKWESAKLFPIAALEVLSFNSNAGEYLHSMNDGKEIPPITKKKSYVVVYRNDYKIFWNEISETEHFLLKEIVKGNTIGESLSLLIKQYPESAEGLEQKIFTWFGEWVSSGYFSRIETE